MRALVETKLARMASRAQKSGTDGLSCAHKGPSVPQKPAQGLGCARKRGRTRVQGVRGGAGDWGAERPRVRSSGSGTGSQEVGEPETDRRGGAVVLRLVVEVVRTKGLDEALEVLQLLFGRRFLSENEREARAVEDFACDVDRCAFADGEGNGIRRPRVELDELTESGNRKLGVERLPTRVVDHHVVERSSERCDYADHKVVGGRSCEFGLFKGNAQLRGLGYAEPDRDDSRARMVVGFHDFIVDRSQDEDARCRCGGDYERLDLDFDHFDLSVGPFEQSYDSGLRSGRGFVVVRDKAFFLPCWLDMEESWIKAK